MDEEIACQALDFSPDDIELILAGLELLAEVAKRGPWADPGDVATLEARLGQALEKMKRDNRER